MDVTYIVQDKSRARSYSAYTFAKINYNWR